MTSSRVRRPPPPLIAAGASLAAFLVLGATVWLAGGPVGPDSAVHRLALALRGPLLDSLARAITFTGSAAFVYPAAVLVAGALWVERRRIAGLVFLAAFGAGAGACGIVKALVDRHRPDPSAMLGPAETGFSFPSGHTCTGTLLFVGAAVMLTATASARMRAQAIGAAMVWSALIAGSRLILGYHWITDTVGSMLLAATVLLPLAAWAARSRQVAARPPAGDLVAQHEQAGSIESSR